MDTFFWLTKKMDRVAKFPIHKKMSRVELTIFLSQRVNNIGSL